MKIVFKNFIFLNDIEKKDILDFKNWLTQFTKNFTKFENFSDLLKNSNLTTIKNHITILKKHLEF